MILGELALVNRDFRGECSRGVGELFLEISHMELCSTSIRIHHAIAP